MAVVRKFNKFKGVETLDQVDIDESITVTDVETTVFTSDSRRVRDSVVEFYNDVSADITIKIFGSANGIDEIPVDADKSWFNILNVLATVSPTTYSHTKLFKIPIGVPWYESFSNIWAWIRITAVVDTGSHTLQIWMRSTQK